MWGGGWKEKLSRLDLVVRERKTRNRTQQEKNVTVTPNAKTHPKFQKSSQHPNESAARSSRPQAAYVPHGINIKEGRTDRQLLRKVEVYVEPVKCVRLNCCDRLCTG